MRNAILYWFRYTVTILKVNVTIYNGENYKLYLTGISGKITSFGETDCHIKMGNEVI